jgi:hypothetical protein
MFLSSMILYGIRSLVYTRTCQISKEYCKRTYIDNTSIKAAPISRETQNR